ncbi:hypothetical protein RSAG8_11620, partial [Rhizoctonia solani AG-8 WAC10335]
MHYLMRAHNLFPSYEATYEYACARLRLPPTIQDPQTRYGCPRKPPSACGHPSCSRHNKPQTPHEQTSC